VEHLGGACDFYKIGSELFTASGPALVRRLIEGGNQVFLDLKFHDIPNTMRGAAASAARLGARLITVHAAAGASGIAAAVEGAGRNCGVLAITVLTSLNAVGLATVWGRPTGAGNGGGGAGGEEGVGLDVNEGVMRLAGIALDSGARGIVCSGKEAAQVRQRFGGRLELLIPGIRPTGSEADDQSRTVTPTEAIQAGASYLVVGRPITGAPDPLLATQAICAEMMSACSGD
jgi:orotidine-5'-phosphate decarboxylase